jgi:phage major head subunit gpT-like protein
MAVIGTGNHPKALWPGVYSWFGAKYDEHEKQYPKLFDLKTSSKNYEELVQHTGFGLAPVKPEGSSTAYDSHSQGYVARGTNVAYSLGYIVTREELADNQYAEVSMRRAGSLAFSMAQTRENVGANVYNRAFNSSYAGGDGKELLATDHPSVSGNQSNELAAAADLSEASLEDLTIQIMNATDPKGLKISLRPKCLVVPTALVYDANRILKSNLRVGTADNDTNALKLVGAIPEIVVNNYLTDTDAWFIRTNAPDSLCWFDREMPQFTKDEDFDTDNAKAKGYMRFVPFWGDWRGLYGSPGA